MARFTLHRYVLLLALAVRYCWADSPICNLYDREGLPAVPFELPIGRAAANVGTVELPAEAQ